MTLRNSPPPPLPPIQLGETPLWLATSGGCVEVVKQLLRLGAVVGIPDDEERTALMIAGERDGCDLVRVLLEHGIDWKATDKNGESHHGECVCGCVCVVVCMCVCVCRYGYTTDRNNSNNNNQNNQ